MSIRKTTAFKQHLSPARVLTLILFFQIGLVVFRAIAHPVGFVCYLVLLVIALLYIFTLFRSIKTRNLKLKILKITGLSMCLAGYLVLSIIYKERLLGMNFFHIPSESMTPTLLVGDIIAVDTWAYDSNKPKAGDIVVFRLPPSGITMVKRVSSVKEKTFSAEGDNPKKSISSYKLEKVPLSNIRGRATFIVVNLRDDSFIKIALRLNSLD